jgi:hypothetical protein
MRHNGISYYLMLLWMVGLSSFFASQHTLDTDTNNDPESSRWGLSRFSPARCSLADGRGLAWLGDNWVPPKGCHIYSIPELKAIYSQYSILWIGDSTVRRVYGSLRAILQSPNGTTSISMDDVDAPHVVDVNKDTIQEVCDKWNHLDWIDPTSLCSTPTRNQPFDFLQVRCLREFASTLPKLMDIRSEYDVVVVSGGSWDIAPLKRQKCFGRAKFPNVLWRDLAQVMCGLQDLQSPSLHIVWRSLTMNQHALEKDVWLEYNRVCRSNLTTRSQNISFLDVATALEHRSMFDERIEGNNIYHLGLKARLLTIQMLANHLLSKSGEWQQRIAHY